MSIIDATIARDLLALAESLRNAVRSGAEVDKPEGTRYIQMSDTLANRIVTDLVLAADTIRNLVRLQTNNATLEISEQDAPMEYTPTVADLEKIEKNFSYHAPKNDQQMRYVLLRDAGKTLAKLIVKLCPPSRELSLAITKCEEAIMWANAAVARNE